jgi:hypothetical protein
MIQVRHGGLIVIALLAASRVLGADPATQSSLMPPDLAAAFEKGDEVATRALEADRLRAHLGEPFPDLRLQGTDQPTRLSKIQAGRT